MAVLATPQKRGQAVGTLTSALFQVSCYPRFISGAIADIAGWRAVYLTAACLMLVIAGSSGKSCPRPRSSRSRSRKSRLTFPIEVRVPAVPPSRN